MLLKGRKFSEIHFLVYNYTAEEAATHLNVSLSALITFLRQFKYRNKPLTFSTLKHLNPKEIQRAFGFLYEEIFSEKQTAIPLSGLSLPDEEYERGKNRGADAAKTNGFPLSDEASQRSRSYKIGYEQGFTTALLRSNESSCSKGLKLGILTKRLGKKSLEELDFFPFICGADKLQKDFKFMKCFEMGYVFFSKKSKPIIQAQSEKSEVISKENHVKINLPLLAVNKPDIYYSYNENYQPIPYHTSSLNPLSYKNQFFQPTQPRSLDTTINKPFRSSLEISEEDRIAKKRRI